MIQASIFYRKGLSIWILRMQFINLFGFHKRKISITCFLNYIQVLSKFALKPNIRGNLQVAGRKLISYPEPLSGFPRLLSVRPINMTTYKSNGRGGVNWVINTVAPNFIYTLVPKHNYEVDWVLINLPLTDDNIVTVAQKLREYPVTKEGCIITTFLNLAVNLLNLG